MTWPLLSNRLSEVASAENRGFCNVLRVGGAVADALPRDGHQVLCRQPDAENPNVHRTRQHPIKCEWKRGGQFQHGM